MSDAKQWLEAIGAIAFVGWFVRTELQIRKLSNELLRTKTELTDKQIRTNVAAISGPELDILLADRLEPGSKTPGELPDKRGKGEN